MWDWTPVLFCTWCGTWLIRFSLSLCSSSPPPPFLPHVLHLSKKNVFVLFMIKWENSFFNIFFFFFFPTICLKHRKLEKVKRCDVKATLYSEIHSMIAKGISKQSFFKFFKNRCQKAHTYCTYGLRFFLILIFMSLPKPQLS